MTVASKDGVRRRFMGILGEARISVLAFKTSVDDPRRLRRSKTMGAYLGLTARRWPGASIDVLGCTSEVAMERFSIRSIKR